MVTDYDETTCITAGELREMGYPIPESIPGCAWVPRDAIRLSLGAVSEEARAAAAVTGELRASIDVTFAAPFRSVTASVRLGP